MHYTYVLKYKDGYYVGCINDLKGRMKRHPSGKVDSTKSRLPLELEMYFAFTDEKIAFRFEKYLKSGFGRAFSKKHFMS